jgi:hypothetical protein
LRYAAKILSNNGQTDFDAIISMETSFGYFGEEGDYQLFKDLTRLSSYSANSFRSSSLLVVDTINRDYLIREFQPFGIHDISEQNLELHMKRKFNLESSLWKRNGNSTIKQEIGAKRGRKLRQKMIPSV